MGVETYPVSERCPGCGKELQIFILKYEDGDAHILDDPCECDELARIQLEEELCWEAYDL